MLNRALLGKWCWTYASEEEAFWKKVIKGKYGEEKRGWCSRRVRERRIGWCGF